MRNAISFNYGLFNADTVSPCYGASISNLRINIENHYRLSHSSQCECSRCFAVSSFLYVCM